MDEKVPGWEGGVCFVVGPVVSGEPNKIKVKLVLGGTKTINKKDLLDSRSENNVTYDSLA